MPQICLHAEFQGELLPNKCQQYMEKLHANGDPAADDFICEDKLWFHATGPKLWSVAIYYTVVTLATCESHAIPACPIHAARTWHACDFWHLHKN
jgi:hypothetical protein